MQSKGQKGCEEGNYAQSKAQGGVASVTRNVYERREIHYNRRGGQETKKINMKTKEVNLNRLGIPFSREKKGKDPPHRTPGSRYLGTSVRERKDALSK